MRDWSDLEQRLPELDLSSMQRKIAVQLIEGRSNEHIASAIGVPARVVMFQVAAIKLALRRRPPPDALVVATTPKLPRPSPLKVARTFNSSTNCVFHSKRPLISRQGGRSFHA